MPLVFNAQGEKVFVPDTIPVNDLTQAPRFDDELPDNVMYSMIVVPSADGTPMIALVNPTLIATTEEVLERIAEARQGLVQDGISRDQSLAAEVARIDALQQNMSAVQASTAQAISQLNARKTPVPLDDVVIPASALITLSVTELVITRPCVGIRTTDAIAVTPKSLSAGYGLRGFSIPANDQITLRVQAPILSVGGTAQTFAVTAFR